MRRLLAATLLAVALVATAPARATVIFEVAGSIAAPNPASKRLNGITEGTNPCGQPDPQLGNLNGLDGYWFALPADSAGQTAQMSSTALDTDVWFYQLSDAGCTFIGVEDDRGWDDMATDLTSHEIGVIPEGATHAVVDLVAGDGSAAFAFRLG